jgi:hypothetical protein
MRFPLAIAACVGLALVTATASGQTAAEGQQSASRMLDLRGGSAAEASSGLKILRGSPAPQRAVKQRRSGRLLGPGPYQVVAGERFWMVDQRTGKLVSCRNRGTANVGERKIECVFGTFSRYSRTFGDNFQH